MDPRITISWAKKKEVPIERLFPKTLRDKFGWAMDNETNWEF
jgi:DNA topoisomerase-1